MVTQETYPDIDHSKINAVPGELTSKITITEKTYGADYVMQMQCIGLQIMSIKIMIIVLCMEKH